MNLMPVMEGRIARRLLVNLRVEPAAAASRLPPGLRPLTVDGWAIAGLCLIRLADLRPPGLPRSMGLATENVAHRVAVEWDDGDGVRTGVWIPRRHTSSRTTVHLGGRLFPAVHRRADFDVSDGDGGTAITVTDGNGPLLSVSYQRGGTIPSGSVFGSVDAAQAFFSSGSLGLSPGRRPGTCDRVDLSADLTAMKPVELVDARSSLLEAWWPVGRTSAWDSAFVLCDVPCRWSGAGAPAPGRAEPART